VVREEYTPTPAPRVVITDRDLKNYPAKRPPIQGKVAVLPETGRVFPPSDMERDKTVDRVSSKRRKGLKLTCN